MGLNSHAAYYVAFGGCESTIEKFTYVVWKTTNISQFLILAIGHYDRAMGCLESKSSPLEEKAKIYDTRESTPWMGLTYDTCT